MNAEHLYDENTKLKRQLRAFVEQAKDNEQKYLRLNANILKLLAANDLASLFEIILSDYRADSKLDVVTLTLIDAEYEIRRTLKNEGFKFANYPGLIFVDSRYRLRSRLSDDMSPLLGKCDEKQKEFYFPRYELLEPVSMAILPLIRNRKLVGSLNLGSYQENRFIEGTATDFFEQFTSVVAISIENALNQERIKQLGLIDPLTGVHNRRYFDQRLDEEITRAARTQKPLSCLFLDIDHFKKFNDEYGHQIGDRVLQEVAAIIKAQMRGSDVMARYGGEEFAVLLSNTDTKLAADIAERIRFIIAENEYELDDNIRSKISVSVGCSTMLPEHGCDSEETGQQLVAKADSALYAAKDKGRNQVVSRVIRRKRKAQSKAS
ncbi:MAG: DUF484 family protein [Gammaproteobacteria bacterium]|nr:DUF484 family protein [Gammaproteobacteria bacterium]